MSLASITEAAVHDALNAIRYDRSLEPSGLLGLELLTRKIACAGMEDNPRARAWALAQLLDGLVTNQIERLRSADADRGSRTRRSSAGNLRQLIEADIAAGDPERMAWSLLYHRYLCIERRPMKRIAEALAMPQRTLTYRIARGRAALTKALHSAEAEALRAETPPARQAALSRLNVQVKQHSQPEIVRRLLEMAGTSTQGPSSSMHASILDQGQRYVELSVLIDLGEPKS